MLHFLRCGEAPHRWPYMPPLRKTTLHRKSIMKYKMIENIEVIITEVMDTINRIKITGDKNELEELYSRLKSLSDDLKNSKEK